MEKPVEALSQSFLRTKARTLADVPQGRWSCTPTRRTTRSTPTPTGTSPTSTRSSCPGGTTGSTGPGRWTAAIPRPSGTACTASRTARTWWIRRTAGSRTPTTGPTRRRARQPERGTGSPGTWTRPARARAGCTRSACWRGGRTSRSTGCGTRRSTATSRRSRGCSRRCWRRTTRRPAATPLKARLAEPIAVLRGLGLPLVGGIGGDVARGVLGRRAVERSRPRGRRRPAWRRTTTWRRAPRRRSGSARSRAAIGRLARDFGTWRTPVGRDQPVPAAHRRHRAAVRRRRAEHPGAVHLGAVGLARVVRRAHLSRDQADVRHLRQQLRGGGGVREGQRAGEGGDGGRRERRSRVARTSTTRPSATRTGNLRRRVLLSRAARGAHRAGVPSRRVSGRHRSPRDRTGRA